MIPENNKENKTKGEKELKTERKECWNCKAPLINNEWCENCKAPINETIISEVINRIESAEQIKCWRCKGTTSGDICGICGSPLTKIGIDIVKN